MTLPSGQLETCSNPPIHFITNCQATPFQEDLLISALKSFETQNPTLQYLPRDEWPITRHQFLHRHEVEERLSAYCNLSVKYWKYVIELESNKLLLIDPQERLRSVVDLKVLIQCISNRLDEITSILIRDNTRRRLNKKCAYPLPRINSRSEPINNIEEVHQMGREITSNIEEILKQAFLPVPEGTTMYITYSDIPDASTTDPNHRYGSKREQNPLNNQSQS